MRPTIENLRDWIPIRVYERDSAQFLDWCYMDGERFTEPFFNDTIQTRMRLPFNSLFRHQTPIDVVTEVSRCDDIIPPTGFIFHMSRCGSTLVAQMLAALDRNVVISEAPPIDAIVSARDSSTDLEDEKLRSMISVFGRRRHVGEKNYFIKFDSWNTVDLDRISRAFPDVPWIFLYRDPVEVIVSHLRQRGSQMIPGAMKKLLPELSFTEAIQMPAEEYCGRVLAKICMSAMSHSESEMAMLVNYTELPDAVTGRISEHFEINFTPEEIVRLTATTQFNAKTPRMFFEPDSSSKQNDAGHSVRQAAAEWVGPIYEQLEEARLRKSP